MGNPLAWLVGRRPEPQPEATPAEAAPAPPADDAQAEAAAKPKRNPADHLAAWRYKPGQSGNPGGRPKDVSITADLRELSQYVDKKGRTVRRRIAMSLLLQAEHDLKAAKIVLDRLEGRVPTFDPRSNDRGTLADAIAAAQKALQEAKAQSCDSVSDEPSPSPPSSPE